MVVKKICPSVLQITDVFLNVLKTALESDPSTATPALPSSTLMSSIVRRVGRSLRRRPGHLFFCVIASALSFIELNSSNLFTSPRFVFTTQLLQSIHICNCVQNLERGSERQKSERWKIRTLKLFVRMIRTSKDQNVENLKRIRTSKVKLDFRRYDIFWRHR